MLHTAAKVTAAGGIAPPPDQLLASSKQQPSSLRGLALIVMYIGQASTGWYSKPGQQAREVPRGVLCTKLRPLWRRTLLPHRGFTDALPLGCIVNIYCQYYDHHRHPNIFPCYVLKQNADKYRRFNTNRKILVVRLMLVYQVGKSTGLTLVNNTDGSGIPSSQLKETQFITYVHNNYNKMKAHL